MTMEKYSEIFGVFGALSSAMIIGANIALIIILPCFIAWCRIFQKAGLPWERMFVPVYEIYTMFSIAHCTALFWINISVPLIAALIGIILNTAATSVLIVVVWLITYAIFCRKLADTFGKGVGWAIGLFFLYPFFIMGLGFGSAQYQNEYGIKVEN